MTLTWTAPLLLSVLSFFFGEFVFVKDYNATLGFDICSHHLCAHVVCVIVYSF